MNKSANSLIFAEKFTHKAGDTVSSHVHTGAEIVLYGGEGETVICGKPYSFGKNSISVVGGGVMHSEKHFKDGCVIYFSANFGSVGIPLVQSGVYDSSFAPEAPHIIESIYEESRRNRPYGEELIRNKISELLIVFQRACDKTQSGGRDLRYCMNYISENCCGKMDFHMLSEGCGLGYDHFRHLFKKEFGLSPQKALMRERLLRAKAFLESGEATCTEAAMLCGFSDSSQFSRMFTACFGMNPRSVKPKR